MWNKEKMMWRVLCVESIVYSLTSKSQLQYSFKNKLVYFIVEMNHKV